MPQAAGYVKADVTMTAAGHGSCSRRDRRRRCPLAHTTEGLDAAQAIRKESPEIGILVLSAHVEVHRAVDLLSERRRVGYLLKSRVTEVGDFLETLDGRTVCMGSAHE